MKRRISSSGWLGALSCSPFLLESLGSGEGRLVETFADCGLSGLTNTAWTYAALADRQVQNLSDSPVNTCD